MVDGPSCSSHSNPRSYHQNIEASSDQLHLLALHPTPEIFHLFLRHVVLLLEQISLDLRLLQQLKVSL
jgi:hypothetical protein